MSYHLDFTEQAENGIAFFKKPSGFIFYWNIVLRI